jgi:surfactin synthase thioesterase subunit
MAPLHLSLRPVRWVGVVMAIALLWCDAAHAAEPRVLLLRGWLAVFSGGLDHLADELRARGINAEVRRHLYWTTAVSEILRDRAAGKIGPLILVGHSQGGNDAIEIARALQISNVPVDLVITLAPYLPKPVPANVGRAINYF